MKEWRGRAAPIACLGLALSLLASCGGGPAPRHGRAGAAGRGGDFMGVTATRCAQGDDGACRILRATDR